MKFRTIFGMVLLSLCLSLYGAHLSAKINSEVEAAKEKLKSFNVMRESLASTLDSHKGPITPQTFQQVCMPVGKAFKDWAKENSYLAKQIAERNRNPEHRLEAEDIKVFRLLTAKADLDYFVQPVEQLDRKGQQLYYRIPMASSCLHCHGEKSKRPEFIKAKYKQDKAYGFKEGDLRGLYSVFIPAK